MSSGNEAEQGIWGHVICERCKNIRRETSDHRKRTSNDYRKTFIYLLVYISKQNRPRPKMADNSAIVVISWLDPCIKKILATLLTPSLSTPCIQGVRDMRLKPRTAAGKKISNDHLFTRGWGLIRIYRTPCIQGVGSEGVERIPWKCGNKWEQWSSLGKYFGSEGVKLSGVEHSNSRFESIRLDSLCESIWIDSFCKKIGLSIHYSCHAVFAQNI